MPFFTKISLVQFRNYMSQSFNFNKKIVGICGANGSGKTNLLDAIYYLCFTKSYFSKPDAKNAMHGLQGFRIDGIVDDSNKEQYLTCILRETGKKEFYVDDDVVKKFSSHIGRFPCVFIAPDDSTLITGGSEERRKFLDTILSQLFPDYLQELIDYNKLLLQRNSCLKNLHEQQSNNFDLLDVLDEQLANAGQKIFSCRKEFLETLIPIALQQYEAIADKDENVVMNYQSQLLDKSLLQLLKDNRQRDLYLQRTTAGIHKDDLTLLMDNEPFKQLASQGQRKSLLFALKLAEYFSIKNVKKHSPVLLLDDVFEKLDEDRMLNLLNKVCNDTDAQIFITDTHKQRLDMAFSELKQDWQMIEL
ncbi:DNA recombination protein RecF [Arachidicoccus ginsenosidimutans]|uniref:DNA replication/repair protein RecF n=1 Tax=Arachidicoccus sp. BS20 TaxID=1850526 RepID=UPI0007F1641E|nr:DNA replication and repair protein RecF [Arachidicoccus sp. BS20]ANI89150.1 DNA recombination protein RecF [Arachidicoccus sp. BS20]